MTNRQSGLGQTDVTPTGSFLQNHEAARVKYFGNVGAPVYVVFEEGRAIHSLHKLPGLDYTDFDVQDAITAVQKDIKSSIWTVNPLLSWWNDFYTWSRLTPPS